MCTEIKGISMKLASGVIISTALLTTMAPAVAQSTVPASGVIKTASGIDLIPSVQVGLKHDDNVVRSSSNEISSWVNSIAPALKAMMVDGADSYTVTAAINNARYFSSQQDDFTDGYLDAEAKISPSSHHNFKLKANTSWLHEDRGTGVSEGRGLLLNDVTKFNSQFLEGEYVYGAQSSTGKIRLNSRYFNKNYDNFRDVTQYRDYDSTLFGGAFVYQTNGSIKMVASASTAAIDFKVLDLSGDRNNTDNNYRVGVEWEITSITSGELKLGYQDKNFDRAQREDFSGFAWEAILVWQPLTYSGFDIATGRRAKDVDAVNVLGDYIIETTYGLGWNHQWSETWDTKIAYEYQTNKYNLSDRTDTGKVITLELNKQLLRWVKIKAFANIENRTSTLGVIEFDRTVLGLNAEFTL
jgi:polysaccharide biosynthesis protein VpsM